MPEPSEFFVQIAGVLFLVAAIELGLAFIMRGQREASSDD